MEGGHGFGDWRERYHQTHPEIFALQPDGTRSGFPNPRTVKLCMSNPKVWELWLEDVEQQLATDPTRTVFNASPNDGWSSGHCVLNAASDKGHRSVRRTTAGPAAIACARIARRGTIPTASRGCFIGRIIAKSARR